MLSMDCALHILYHISAFSDFSKRILKTLIYITLVHLWNIEKKPADKLLCAWSSGKALFDS